jgi:D-arabinose 1-dehydrogenase-like Zn-dependent alcohol dehydrogenase
VKTFGLDQAGKALAEMAAGHVRGKLVITLREP